MAEHDLTSLSPLEKLFQVWEEWGEGEDIETLPIQEVDKLLAEMGIDPGPTISSVQSFVESQNTKESRGEQKIESNWDRYTDAMEEPEVIW